MAKEPKWTTLRVTGKTGARAEAIRVILLRLGPVALPPRLRTLLVIPANEPYEKAVRKLGVGQILALGLALLEREIRDNPPKT